MMPVRHHRKDIASLADTAVRNGGLFVGGQLHSVWTTGVLSLLNGDFAGFFMLPNDNTSDEIEEIEGFITHWVDNGSCGFMIVHPVSRTHSLFKTEPRASHRSISGTDSPTFLRRVGEPTTTADDERRCNRCRSCHQRIYGSGPSLRRYDAAACDFLCLFFSWLMRTNR